MKGENFKARFLGNAVPVMVAMAVMFLILITIPMTSTPAKVFGGYGWKDYMTDPTGVNWIKFSSFNPPHTLAVDSELIPNAEAIVGSELISTAVAAATNEPAPMVGAAAYSEPTLATVAIYAAAIRGNNVDYAGFTLDGVSAASWSLSGDGDLVLNFKLDGIYAAGDVVTLSGKYKDGTSFTVSVTVK